jgi:hypothetical protein
LSAVQTGLSVALASNEKVMLEQTVAVKLKQLSAQVVMSAQPFADFCVLSLGALGWWSQSGMAADADISVIAVLAA